MNWRHLIIAVTLLGTPAAAADIKDRPLEEMQAALKLGQTGDSKGCLKIVQRVVGASSFNQLATEFRIWSFTIGAFCASDAKDTALAHDYAVRGTDLDGASADLWRVRILREMQDEAHPEAAVISFETMARRTPDVLNALPQQWIYLFYNRLKKLSDITLRRRILEVLAARSYEPAEVGGSADFFRTDLATLRAGEGDQDGAAALIANITQPSTLLRLSVDPRTRAFLPANFDIRAVTESELKHRRDVAASHPSSLAAVIEVANALRWLGRYQEALAGLEAASPDGPASTNFTDVDDRRNWWWDAVGYANAFLGRYDATLAAFRQGIDAKESGTPNVSQTINLANQQVIFGHNEDAVKTLAPLGEGKGASPYGVMQLIGVRGCAKFRIGDKAGADADYAYAKVHEADAPDTVTSLALCRTDRDAAAGSLVRRLDDPDRRVDALLFISDYDPPPAAYPKQPEDAELEKVKARPEVKAAIVRAGGARRFNLTALPF